MKWFSPLSWWSTLMGFVTTLVGRLRSETSPAVNTSPKKSKPQAKRGRPEGFTNKTRKSKPTAFQSSSRKKSNSGTKK